MKRLGVALFATFLASTAALGASGVERGTGGGVAAAEETAAKVGIEILQKGGNAADAAVAVAFALAVTWPEAGNIGGGGFWISRDPRGRTLVVDFREVAPRAARRDLFLKPGPGGKTPSSTEGPLASGVPGSVAGLELAHRLAGKLPWKVLLEPAVRLARDGFVVSDVVHRSITLERSRLAGDPETASIFLPDGAAPGTGITWKQRDLGRTLENIRDRGADGFYRGLVARRIEESQQRAGGLITRGDLARYQPRVRPALEFRLGKTKVLTTPAPSSGPVLAEMALLAQYVGLDKIAPGDATAAHYLAEIEKRAYADRNRYLADPGMVRVEQKLFTDPSRLRAIAAKIPAHQATPADALRETVPEKPTTTHFSVVDGSGAAVSVTTTLNDSFGNARVAPGLGFLWNNEMDDFTARPGQKNLYGLVQGEANAIAPGKRMLSSMCPSIAVVDGRNALVWGSPGGATIPTTNFQVMLNALLRGESLESAVAAPRFHQQDFPDKIQYEDGRFDGAWVEALEKLGHTVAIRVDEGHHAATLGRVHAVALGAGGQITAVADPRSGGVGLVVHPAP
ncbi:MAG TPA: gamma-glutamyltransferase [Thermoanaerobaculia bacterium]